MNYYFIIILISILIIISIIIQIIKTFIILAIAAICIYHYISH